jgi:hypothetical protein
VLELDDIQYIILNRAPALVGRYEFLTFQNPEGGQAWLAGISEKVHSVESVRATLDQDNRWVTIGFTWNGLQALGVDDASLATFPEEFKQGMVARSEILGDSGENHPDNWYDDMANPKLHAIVIFFARNVEERDRSKLEHQNLVAFGCCTSI